MATGGYSEFHASVSGHRGGGRRGGRSSYFRSRGQGRGMSQYQSEMQSDERDYDYQNTRLDQSKLSHDYNYYAHRGSRGKYRGQERGGRRTSDPNQQHHMKDYTEGM